MTAKNKKPQLSIAMATYNEEQNLDFALSSIKGWADEIIIFDGSSSDKTVNIAKKYSDKVFIVDNPPHFHVNKQKAIEKCQGEWIFQLDADEQLTDELKKEISNIVNTSSEYNGYFVPRRNYFLAHWMKKTANYPDPVIRLFKNGKGRVPAKTTHEQIEIDGKIGTLTNDMLHFGDISFTRYLIRSNRYSTMDARYLKKANPELNFKLAISYLFWLPLTTFLKLYFRHQGFRDGMAGFAFSLFSSFHYISTYLKYYESKKQSLNRPDPLDYWA